MNLRYGAVALTIVLLSGCISYTNKPTHLMVKQQLRKEKKLVAFRSDVPLLQLARLAVDSTCGKGAKTVSTIQPTGTGGFVGVASTYDHSVTHGLMPDGATWVALRTDGLFHGTPIGYRLKQESAGMTDVTVYAADKRKALEIQREVEAGTFFCNWEKYSYPFD